MRKFSGKIDFVALISHYYIKACGFLAYLFLIVLVSCSSAVLSSIQVQQAAQQDVLIESNQEQINLINKKISTSQKKSFIQIKTAHDWKEEQRNNTPQNIKNQKKYPVPQGDEIIQETPSQDEVKKKLTNSIAIIIDDCGIDADNTGYIVETMPKEITLSYLPYAEKVQQQVDEGKKFGHEIMLHLPMEAISYNESGINTLRGSWDDKRLIEQTNKFLDTFNGYTGVNNHTGSKLTQNYEKMNVVMKEIKARNLNFIDSVTINTSIAYDVAKEQEVPVRKRNIFIDHKDDSEYVFNQLVKAEDYAKKNGLAIIIGHPRDNTIIGLNKWLANIEERDINLVPISAVY